MGPMDAKRSTTNCYTLNTHILIIRTRRNIIPMPEVAILQIKLFVNGIEKTSYAFIDNGANVSMIDSNFAQSLGLHGSRERLELQ